MEQGRATHAGGTRQRAEASSRGRPMPNANWLSVRRPLLVVAQWPRRRARPRFSQIELDPPCGAPNWDKGGWNNKAEPLDCPPSHERQGQGSFEAARAVVCPVKGEIKQEE